MNKALSEAEAQVMREVFIRNHHHLISPWAYPKEERAARDGVLLAAKWEQAK
jgi:hypothetical protein